MVLGFHKFPEGQVKADIVLYCTVLYCTVQVVVDTAVLLERDRDNFIHLLDLWAAQVPPAPGHNPSISDDNFQAQTYRLGKFSFSEDNVIVRPMLYCSRQ